MRLKSTTVETAVLGVILALSGLGCLRDRDQREWQYMPDMYRSDAIKAQEAAPAATALDTSQRGGISDALPKLKEEPGPVPEDTAMGADSVAGDTAAVPNQAKGDSVKKDTTGKDTAGTDTAKGDTAESGSAETDTARADTTGGDTAGAGTVAAPPRRQMVGYSLMRMPPEGTVPRDKDVYWPVVTDTLAAISMLNPLPVTEAVLETGQRYFDIYCAVCHGKRGRGDGPIIPKMPPPPSLSSEKVRNWADGRINHVIVHGQGNMPPYRSTVDAPMRWAIIRYLRVIQRAENPTSADLDRLRQEKSLLP